MPNGGGRPALDPEPPPLDPREKDVPKSFRIPSAEGRGAMSRDAGKAEPCKCPECGGPATRRYMSSHPFGAGTGYYEYNAASCACGGREPIDETGAEIWDVRGDTARGNAYVEVYGHDLKEGQVLPCLVFLPEVRGSEA